MAEKWKDTVNITLRPYGNLYLEEERVKTYVHWPIDTQAFVMTMACAKTGFFYTGKADYTLCAVCDIELTDWERADSPHGRHSIESPNCPMVLGEKCKNVTLTTTERNEIRAALEMNSIRNSDAERARIKGSYGIDARWPPSNTHFEDFDRRKKTFKSYFPHQHRILEFAEAGFVYRGNADAVECFYCAGVLERFEPHDNLWREHARWFPGCVLVRSRKGTDFIIEARQGMSERDLAIWQGLRETYREDDIEFLDDPNEFKISMLDGFKRCKAKKYHVYNIRRAYEANGNKEFTNFEVLEKIVKNLEEGLTGPYDDFIDTQNELAEAARAGAQPAASSIDQTQPQE